MTSRIIAAAANDHGAVAVCEYRNTIAIWKYAPRAIGTWERRDEFQRLAARAAAKLGWTRHRRCRGGWRRVNGGAR